MSVGTATYTGEELERCPTMQKEEFEVLESIYPEYVSSQSLDGSLKLEIPIEFGSPKSVMIFEPSIPPPSNPAAAAGTSLKRKPTILSASLSTLPPLLLHLILPPAYPLHVAPQIASIRATHEWLPDPAQLSPDLLQLWQPGEPVLYNWIEHIRTGEFLERLDLLSITDPDLISLPHPAPQMIVPLLQTYDESLQSKQFAQSSYLCSVCLTSLKGSKCLQLHCKHIFCRSCLEDFWKMCIQEGDIGRVSCPDPECIKKGSEAGEEEVARVVTDAELQRWKWLREKRAYERDPTIIHCPISVCQGPVPKPADIDDDSGSGWNKFRQCPKCLFSFCAYCKRTWHGPITHCAIAQYETLVKEYIEAPEGSAKRVELELRFGKVNIKRLVANYKEEQANLELLKSSTTTCPGCQCHVEKNTGCNHMTCWKCRQHFCYRCGQKLNALMPYDHFSQPGTSCYNRLFDFDPDEWQMDFNGDEGVEN